MERAFCQLASEKHAASYKGDHFLNSASFLSAHGGATSAPCDGNVVADVGKGNMTVRNKSDQ